MRNSSSLLAKSVKTSGRALGQTLGQVFGLAGTTVAALALVAGLSAAPAAAQKAAAKTATAKAGAKPKSGRWVKICRTMKLKEKGKDKKVVEKNVNVCRVQTESLQIDFDFQGKPALVPIYRAVITEIKDKKLLSLSVEVPPGMALPPGLPVAVLNKAQWTKIQKREKLDLSKGAALRLPYLVCKRISCNAELKIKPELVEKLKKGAGLLLQPIDILRGPVTIVVPLLGFTAAFNGPGEDLKSYSAKRAAYLKAEVARVQKLRAEAQKKKAAAAPKK